MWKKEHELMVGMGVVTVLSIINRFDPDGNRDESQKISNPADSGCDGLHYCRARARALPPQGRSKTKELRAIDVFHCSGFLLQRHGCKEYLV